MKIYCSCRDIWIDDVRLWVWANFAECDDGMFCASIGATLMYGSDAKYVSLLGPMKSYDRTQEAEMPIRINGIEHTLSARITDDGVLEAECVPCET